MAVSIVVEDGTGLATANSYISRANAQLYFDRSAYSVEWAAAAGSLKDKALMQASRWLDDYFEFDGKKVGTTQALEWPRFSIKDRSGYHIPSTTIPTEVQEATAELAQFIIRSDRTAEPGEMGFENIKVGPISITPNSSDRTTGAPIPPIVTTMLKPFGRIRSMANPEVVR